MANTVTPTEGGGFEVSQSNEHMPWHRGVSAFDDYDEVSGERFNSSDPDAAIQRRLGTYESDDGWDSFDEIERDPTEIERHTEYLNALVELNPALPSAVEWASKGWDPDFVQRWNACLDAEDWTTLNQLAERLMDAYSDEAGNTVEPTEVEREQSLDDLAEQLGLQDELAKVEDGSLGDLSELKQDVFSMQPQPELADQQRESADELFRAGDYDQAFVHALSSGFHQGEFNVAKAVQQAVSKMGLKRAIAAYTKAALGYNAINGMQDVQYGRQQAIYDDYYYEQ